MKVKGEWIGCHDVNTFFLNDCFGLLFWSLHIRYLVISSVFLFHPRGLRVANSCWRM